MPGNKGTLLGMLVTLLAVGVAQAADGGAATLPGGAPLARGVALALQLGLIMAAARGGSMLFERLRLPSPLGALTAGIILCPALLGGLPLPGLPAGLHVPLAASAAEGNALGGMVMLALVTMLFTAGLETDLRSVRRHAWAGIAIGLGGMLAALLLTGLAVGTLAPWDSGRGILARAFSPAGVFTAVAAAVSSVGLAARTLVRQRRTATPEGSGIVAAVMVDNLAGVLLLAVVAIFAGRVLDGAAATPALLLRMTTRTAAVGLLAAALALPLVHWAGHRISRLERPASLATLALAAALIVGGLLGRLSFPALAGAYLVGLILSTSDWRHPIQERLEFMNTALVPVGIAVLGMQFQPEQLGAPRVLLFIVAFTSAAVLGKLLGCALPARLSGFNARGALRIGLGMELRGETALAVLAVGLTAGVLPPPAFTAVVVLLYLAGLVAPPLLRLAFRGECGVRRAFGTCDSRPIQFTFPSPSAAGMAIASFIEQLSNEGFFVHLLDRRESLYQLSKDKAVLGLHQEGQVVSIDCADADRDLVRAAMVEVLATIERNLRDLRRPLEAPGLRKGLQTADSATVQPPSDAGAAMRPFLTVSTLRPRLLADTKAGVIAELIDLLDEEGLVINRHEALSAVIAREEGLSTGLEHGVAIPHGRTDAVARMVCAIGLRQEGVDFGSLDGRPARIVVLLLAPASAAAPQLRFIALIGRILNERGRAALLACDTAEDMYAVLTEGVRPEGAGRRRDRRPEALACLHWHGIALDLTARTRTEVLDQLMALCARSGAVSVPEDARQAVLAREHKGSTGMEHGVALPHARTEAVDRMVCAVGISRQGVDFGALDGQLSHIFVMVLMPPSVTTEYTRLTGTLMRALDEPGRQAILAAKSSQDVLDILGRAAGGAR